MNNAGKNPLLEIKELCKDYPPSGLWGKNVRAVDNVDMAVEPGEIRGIVGESGSGKTTLVRCSLRLIEPSSGSVHFEGQNLSTLSAAALRAKRRDFQMIFQDAFASLNPWMTVEQILLEPFQIHKAGSRESKNHHVRKLLEAVSLSASLLHRRPAELSGGQQQRVGIARGLALQPKLLIADEPVSALDASVQAQILNLLADLKRRHDFTLILISHSLHVVHYLCSHVSVLYGGKLVEDAPAPSFFKQPKHPYSRLLLDALPVLDPKQRSFSYAAKATPSPVNCGSGCVFYARCIDRMPVCAEQTPPLLEMRPGEKVACFLFSK